MQQIFDLDKCILNSYTPPIEKVSFNLNLIDNNPDNKIYSR